MTSFKVSTTSAASKTMIGFGSEKTGHQTERSLASLISFSFFSVLSVLFPRRNQFLVSHKRKNYVGEMELYF